jgi:hypothetical protein
MRKTLMMLAAGTALLGAPAFAQPDSDTAAEPVDSAVAQAPDAVKLTPATREQVRAGAEIADTGGNSIGTVQSIDGDTAIVVKDGKLYDVPLSSIHLDAGNPHRLVTTLAPDEIQARTAASAETGGVTR